MISIVIAEQICTFPHTSECVFSMLFFYPYPSCPWHKLPNSLIRVTHNAKKWERRSMPESHQTALALSLPPFLLTALRQANTRCLPLSQTEKKGKAVDLWLKIADLQSCHRSHWTSDSVAESNPEFPRTAGIAEFPGHPGNTLLTFFVGFLWLLRSKYLFPIAFSTLVECL